MKQCLGVVTIIGAMLFVASTHVATAQESVIYSFVYAASDGLMPFAGLTPDGAGNFYGTTVYGGSVGSPYNFDGTVYELSPASGGAWTEKVLYSFGVYTGDGTEPYGGVIFDSKGNLYGTTNGGGANGQGAVFELSPGSGGTWAEQLIYSFKGGLTDGASPRRGSLVFDSKGNLYGTTFSGGANGATPYDGTVYELSPGTGGAWTEKIIHNFGATGDGANPVSGLTFDAAGNLYGTTDAGGVYNYGTVYELTPGSGGTWTETVLHSFDINGVDGANPLAGVIIDAQGNLYGNTQIGGSYGQGNHLGTVYELSKVGGVWTEQILYSFTGNANGTTDGVTPVGNLIFDAAGNLYGTTFAGGVEISSEGTVYELLRSGGTWTEKILYAFTAALSDGHAPESSLVFDATGNLYGTTSAGGTNSAGQYGTVFKLAGVVTPSPKFSPPGGAYSSAQTVTISDAAAGSTIYYTINGSISPAQYKAPVKVSSSETITAYAISSALPQSAAAAANYQIGTVAATPWFSPPAGTYTAAQSVTITDAAPKATIYYTTNGTTPTASSTKYTGPISVKSTETLEAIAIASGYSDSAVGSSRYTITVVTPPTEKLLYSFGATSDDGGVPLANLVSDSKGNFYGTTKYGGPNDITYSGNTTTAGTAFELSPKTGGGYTEKVIYDFGASTSDGALPIANLIFDSKGNLYGTTLAGGSYGLGTAFELSPGTGSTWTEKILYSFGVNLADGKSPAAGLVFDSKGNLYGTTNIGGESDTTFGGGYGTVFELSPGTGSTWTETVLYNFSYLSQTDGYFPASTLVFDANGNLYGTTADGGTAQDLQGGGTVFELSPAGGSGWTEKVIYNFGGGSPQGYEIDGGVVLDAAGNIYGTAHYGANGFGLDGTIFELSPASGGTWTFQVLHSFGAYEGDGINPLAGLVFAAGNLYGTTYHGGANGYGAVFELSPQSGGGWIESVLHSFNLSATDGVNPSASLILDASGNLYGTTAYGGADGPNNTGTVGGTVFEIGSAVSSAPVVTLSTTSLTFSAQATGTTSAAKIVTVKNTGTASLTISGIAITGADPGDFAKTTTCGASLAAGASCTISVTFKPTATGTLSATAGITDNAAGTPQGIALSGVGTTAELTPATVNFGTLATGSVSAVKTVTLKNIGTASLTISGVAITGTDPGDFAETTTCGTSLAAAASCTISVTFKPTASGTRGATLGVTDSAAGSPQPVTLTGVGTTAKLTPAGVNFGALATGLTSAVKTVTLKNIGTASLTISGIAIAGTDPGDFAETTTCGASLAAAASCTISVTFKPTTTGARSATLDVTDNASGSPQPVSLTGIGTTAELTPSSLNFGTLATASTSSAKTVTLKNIGTASITISGVAITGTDSGDYSETTTCGSSLAAAASCGISVTFKPTATGTRSATLDVTDDAAGTPQLVTLTGVGTTAKLTPTSLNLGTVTTGTASPAKTVTLKNVGTASLTISDIAITGTDPGDFSQTHTCGSSLAAGASCTISVTFKPTATGARSAALGVTDSGGGSPQSVTLSGTGG
jgi:uncharacterized repeat protein (TIGR03803 family)